MNKIPDRYCRICNSNQKDIGLCFSCMDRNVVKYRWDTCDRIKYHRLKDTHEYFTYSVHKPST